MIDDERKLLVASSAASTAQHSSFANAEKARNCRKEREEAEVQSGVRQIVANKVCDNAKTAKEVVFKFEVEYIAELRRRWDEINDWMKQLRK